MKPGLWKLVYFSGGCLVGICLGLAATFALPGFRPTEVPVPESTLAAHPTDPTLLQDTLPPTPETTGISGAKPTEVPTTAVPTSATPTSAVPTTVGTALVLRAIDGDTLEVQIGDQTTRLRYIGIDAPEEGAPFSAEAAEANRLLVEGRQVVLEKDTSETDRYGRLLRYVYLPDGTFINAELLRTGCARAVAYPPDTRYQDYLTLLEAEAQRAGRCLWGSTPELSPTPEAVPVVPLPATTGTPSGQGIVIDPSCSQFNAPGDDNTNKNEEYVCLSSSSDQPIDLRGWSIHDEYGWSYAFPAFSLAPGTSVLIRTGCGSDTAQDLYWCRSDTAIWNNGGDCAYLLNAQAELVFQFCY